MSQLTFRSSRIIYYGPHACENCGAMVCKMSIEFGGNAFNYPSEPIYPNTEWHAHVCDPKATVEWKSRPGYHGTVEPPSHPAPSSAGIYQDVTDSSGRVFRFEEATSSSGRLATAYTPEDFDGYHARIGDRVQFTSDSKGGITSYRRIA
jgi:hypothetical protein